MNRIQDLIKRNRAWARRVSAEDPGFFSRLAHQHSPEILWIGCSDSRVPSTQIVDLDPGEIFVHRNVANVIVHTDLNALSTIQFAVEALQVKHVLVVGHYGCGGVGAVLEQKRLGLIDNWLRHVDRVARLHRDALPADLPFAVRHARLCELNAIEQAMQVADTTVVSDAWQRGQPLKVHAWIYGLEDGCMHDLGLDIAGSDEREPAYRKALENLANQWNTETQA
ncbi:MAG: carbonate dehydratase [Rhodanobacteraceae bacterium]